MLLCFGCGGSASAATMASAGELEVFVRPGCLFCEEAKRFLTDLQRQRPVLRVRIRDISQDPEASQELSELADRFGIRAIGVPAFYLRDELIIGFLSAEIVGNAIEALLDQAPAVTEGDASNRSPTLGVVDMPILGQVHVRQLGLILLVAPERLAQWTSAS